MKNRLNYLKTIYACLFCCIFIFSNLFAQTGRIPFFINEEVGDTVDLNERDHCQIFLNFNGFKHACFFLNEQGNLDVRIRYEVNNVLKDTMLINYTNIKTLENQIRNMTILNGEMITENSENSSDSMISISHFENPDPNITRSFLLPTAYNLPVGKGYVGNFEIFAFTGAVGFTDNLMFNADMILLPFGQQKIEFSGNFGLKYNLYNVPEKMSIGLCGQAFVYPGTNYNLDLAALVVSLGDSYANFSLLGGAAYYKNNHRPEMEWAGFMGASGQVTIIDNIKLLGEMYYLGGGTPFVFGVRFYWKNISADIGAGTLGSVNLFPVFNIFWSF